MDTNNIIAELKAERDRLDQAISVLRSSEVRHPRPYRRHSSLRKNNNPQWTAAKRRVQSARMRKVMRKWWKKRKQQEATASPG